MALFGRFFFRTILPLFASPPLLAAHIYTSGNFFYDFSSFVSTSCPSARFQARRFSRSPPSSLIPIHCRLGPLPIFPVGRICFSPFLRFLRGCSCSCLSARECVSTSFSLFFPTEPPKELPLLFGFRVSVISEGFLRFPFLPVVISPFFTSHYSGWGALTWIRSFDFRPLFGVVPPICLRLF